MSCEKGQCEKKCESLLVNASEASKMLGISDRTLWTISHPRGSVPVVKIGSRVLYSVAALERWISEQQNKEG
jgi:hypothetical protein